MHDLKPITPLGGIIPRIDHYDGLTVTENPDRALASLTARQGHETACAEAAKTFLGAGLPGVGKSVETGVFSAFWIGPDAWMIDADHASHELLASQVKAAMGATASVVEQTDGWCRFDVEGARVCDLFERLCNADIRAMETGAVIRSAIHHMGCFVWCRDAGTFAVLGPRSSAKSLHHALTEVAQAVTAG